MKGASTMGISKNKRAFRRTRSRVPRPISPPMLITRGLQNDDLEIRERMCVEAFANGWATREHFDALADMRDCLLLAAAVKKDATTIGMCSSIGVALMNIRDRYAATHRMDVAADELQDLRSFATTYRDFWLRQSGGTYKAAYSALRRARATNSLEIDVPSVQRISE